MSWLITLVLPEAADPIVLDLGVSNVRIAGRPQPDGNWLATAGHSYNGLCGAPPLDSIIGSYDTADEAIAAGVVKGREGAEIVLAPGFGNDVTAALGEGGKAGSGVVRRKDDSMRDGQFPGNKNPFRSQTACGGHQIRIDQQPDGVWRGDLIFDFIHVDRVEHATRAEAISGSVEKLREIAHQAMEPEMPVEIRIGDILPWLEIIEPAPPSDVE